MTSPTPTKRKSRFGLSSLLGKRASKEKEAHRFPTMRNSGTSDDIMTNGYNTSISRHSGMSLGGSGPGPRLSITSRRALEELVSQDAEFVAYRYPSSEQRLDLAR